MPNKLLILLLTVVVTIFIAGAVGLTMFMYREAHRAQEVAISARYRAEIDRRRAEAMSEFFAATMQPAEEAAQGADMSVGTLLDRAAETAETSFEGDPGTEAGIRLAIGRSYLNLGEFEKAETELLRAHELEQSTEAIEALVELYEEWGRADAAATWRLKLQE
jgi:tetratricopeptide (TPR) repeat protein